MNCAAGKISNAAKEAIKAAGGSVVICALTWIMLATMPGAKIRHHGGTMQEQNAYIELPTGVMIRFTRAWDVKDCSLDLFEPEKSLKTIAVGKITDEARQAIESRGGIVVSAPADPSLLLVILPDNAQKEPGDVYGARIVLPAQETQPEITLEYSRPVHFGDTARDCGMYIVESQGEQGKP